MATASARVAQKEQLNPAFASAALAAEPIMTRLAKQPLVKPPKGLVEEREPRRGRGAGERAVGSERKRAWVWRGEKGGEGGRKAELKIVEQKVKPEERKERGRGLAEKSARKEAAAIVRRVEIEDARLRELVSRGIEGLGAEHDVIVSDGDEVYFFHAADPEYARMLKGNAAALAMLGRRLGQFVDAITVNGIVYIVTKRGGVKATTDGRVRGIGKQGAGSNETENYKHERDAA